MLNWPSLKKPILVTYNGMTNILKLSHEIFRSVSSLRLLTVGWGEGSLSTPLQANARGQSASSHGISKVLRPLIYFLCLDKMTAARLNVKCMVFDIILFFTAKRYSYTEEFTAATQRNLHFVWTMKEDYERNSCTQLSLFI